MSKLYTVARGDLSPGYQLAMSVHAASEFAFRHPELHAQWMKESRYLVCLSCEDKAQLMELYEHLHYAGLATALWVENDLDNEPAAFAVMGDERTIKKALSRLPLALREKVA